MVNRYKQHIIRIVTSVLLLFFSNIVFANTTQALSLFTETKAKQTESQSVEGTERWVKEINPLALSALESNQANSLSVNYGNEDKVFNKVEGFNNSANQAESTNQNMPIVSNWVGQSVEGTQLLLTISEGTIFGNVMGENQQITLRPTGTPNQVILEKSDISNRIPFIDDGIMPPNSSNHLNLNDSKGLEIHKTESNPENLVQINVMVLYTPGIAADYPGTQIITRIQHLINLTNLAFFNSSVNTWLNLVYWQQVTYADDSVGGMNQALTEMTNNVGVFTDLENLRTLAAADQVTLLRKLVDEGCGLAWVGTSLDARYAYAVTHDGVRSDGAYCDQFTYGHEVGHNLGLMHDRANSGFPGIYNYSYGYQDPQGRFGTVMSYSCSTGNRCPTVAHFSNPDVTYQGLTTGYPEGHISSADNARTINQTMTTFSQYR